jgi:hypothetical protein
VETIRSCFAVASEAQQTLIVKEEGKKHNRKQQHKLERSAQ